MRALLMAAVLIATPAVAQEVPPDWIKQPTSDELKSVWPRKALEQGRGGKASLKCTLTARGLIEGCSVESEDPPGQGFGEAALLLVPSFVIKPAMKDGKPVDTAMRIPFDFKTQGSIDGTLLRKAPMVTEPIWERAPSFADMAAAWPKGATAEFGHVSMRCGFTREGLLEKCQILTETPRGQGFARAANQTVARLFKLRTSPEMASEIAKASVNLPIRFSNPNVNRDAPRTIAEPKWITRVNPEKVVGVYPEAAVKAGVKTGRGVANCMVAADGRLTDCKPATATPEGLGFSEAAVEVAKVMVMNPWSDGGGPVDGVRIKLPVTFNLAPEQQAATPGP